MEEYQELVRNVVEDGTYKPNRTGIDTISDFSQSYTVDLQDGFPLLTTKKMDGYRWNSLIHELIWYFSGEEHIRNLREETKIWDAWADEADGKWLLDTAYGRFWRRYPVPEDEAQLEGESWPDDYHRWVTVEEDGRKTFDQLQYVIDTLNENPQSRRMVVKAWHPANAAVSTLPPCHFTYVFNVQDDKLNLHLTQRSGDIALGVPFNIACYSIIANAVAQQTGFEPGEFSHTIVDAHIYCGKGERGEWYGNNMHELSERVANAEEPDDFLEIKGWIEDEAPEEDPDEDTDWKDDPYDHVPGLLEQLSREPLEKPGIEIADRPIDDLTFDDITLVDYESHDGLDFGVAE